MMTEELLKDTYFVQLGICITVLIAIFRRRAHHVFAPLAILLVAQTLVVSVSLAMLFYRKTLHLSLAIAYPTYYWSTWVLTFLILVLRILTIQSIFAEAMRPLAGLHKAGKLIFRWVGVVSALVAVALLSGPGMFSTREGIISILSHLQQGVCVLTLCLLIFVCFAVRPLGLTFRSHLFGVSLGLGVASTVELVQAAWLVTYGARSLYSSIYLFSSLGACVSLLVWGVYFGMPEPARRMILLPTTSPFFFWNRISEILGDSPGQVAIAGFSPNMLAPAEIEMLTTATANENQRELEEELQVVQPEPDLLPSFAGAPAPSLA